MRCTIAGAMGKLQAVDFSPDLTTALHVLDRAARRIVFVALLFRHRPVAGATLHRRRGVARRPARIDVQRVFKIPMQFFILLLGALLFVFYQFRAGHAGVLQPDRMAASRRRPGRRDVPGHRGKIRRRCTPTNRKKSARGSPPASTATPLKNPPRAARWPRRKMQSNAVRQEARDALKADRSERADQRFGLRVHHFHPDATCRTASIGLLIAVMFAAALSSKAGELNALGTTSTIDLWRHFRPLAAHDEARNVRTAKWFTAFWGLFAIGFALFASFAENLIEGLNIVGSIFYPRVLGVFLVAFFLKRVGGTAVFWAAVAAQTLVLALFLLGIAYPAHELVISGIIPSAAPLASLFSVMLQTIFGDKARTRPDTDMSNCTCHLFRPAAVRIFPETLSRRQDPDRAPAAKGDRRRNCFLLSRQRPRSARNPDHPAPSQNQRAGILNFAFANKIQRKFSPLYLKRIAAGLAEQNRTSIARTTSSIR